MQGYDIEMANIIPNNDAAISVLRLRSTPLMAKK